MFVFYYQDPVSLQIFWFPNSPWVWANLHCIGHINNDKINTVIIIIIEIIMSLGITLDHIPLVFHHFFRIEVAIIATYFKSIS